MKISRVVSLALLGASLSCSVLMAENLNPIEALKKNINAYDGFYINGLKNKADEFANVLKSYPDGIKNVTTESLKKGREHEALGDLIKTIFKGMVEYDANGYDYEDYNDKDDDPDTGGWFSANKLDEYRFVSFKRSNGSEVRIKYSKWSGKPVINIYTNNSYEVIRLCDDNSVSPSCSNGDLYIYEFAQPKTNSLLSGSTGLSKDELIKLATLLKGEIDKKASEFKDAVASEGYFTLFKAAIDKDIDENDPGFKDLVSKFSKFGTYDVFFEQLNHFKKTDTKELEHITKVIELLNSVKNEANEESKNAKINEINKYLLDNEITIGVHGQNNYHGYDGFHKNIDKDTKIDELLAVLQKEKQNAQKWTEENAEYEKFLKANEAKIKEFIGEKDQVSDKTQKDLIRAEEKAITDANNAKNNFDNAKSELSKAQAKADEAKKALESATQDQKDQAKAELDKAKVALDEANKALATAKSEQIKAVVKKTEAIVKNTSNSLSNTEKSVVLALASMISKEEALDILSSDKNTIITLVKDTVNSIQDVSNSLNSGVTTDIIKFNQEISTSTRLAKLSNPFNENLALAYAIANLQDDKFADASDSVVDVVKGYTDRFSHDNNVWATFIGGKGSIKNSPNPKIYGFNIGYDKAFDNTIFGSYLSYAKSKTSGSSIKSSSDNYQLGFYSRSFVGNNEIDTRLSFGVGKNDLTRIVANSTYAGKFNSKTTSADISYGYVFGLADAFFVKPTLTISYDYSSNKAFKESGKFGALNYSRVSSKFLNAKLGVEFRKYMSDGSYAYITPMIQKELYKNSNDLMVNYVGSNHNIVVTPEKDKKTFVAIQTGAEFSLTKNLSTSVNFGVKSRSHEKFYNGTIGLRYKF